MRRALTQRPALGVLRRSGDDRFLGHPLPQVARVADHRAPSFAASGRSRSCGRSPSGRTGDWAHVRGPFARAAWIGGVFFAADLVLWHYSIEYVGAGLATVLGNTQVVLVGLLAWLLFRERPSRNSLLAIPVAMVGIVLISGCARERCVRRATRSSARSTACSPGSPTRASCSRCAGAPASGAGSPGRSTTRRSPAAIFVVPIGLVIGNLDFTPGLEAQGWLIRSRSARRCSAGS